jgi:hypothetical protein
MHCSENLKNEIKKINKPLLDKYLPAKFDIDAVVINGLKDLLNNISFIDVLLLWGGRISLSKFFELYVSSDDTIVFCELGWINISWLADIINGAWTIEPIEYKNWAYVSFKDANHTYSGKTYYVSESLRNRSGKVYYKLYDGDEYLPNVEQANLKKSTKKAYEESKAKKLYYFYLAEAKQAIERDKATLSNVYSTKLREFLKASTELESAKVKDPVVEAERLYQAFLDFETQFKWFDIIHSVKMVGLNWFELITNDIYITVDDIDAILDEYDGDGDLVNRVFTRYKNTIPVGRFKVTVKDSSIRYDQLEGDIDCGYQHPHISSHTACLGTFTDIIKDTMSKKDYFQVVLIILDHLSVYNAESPYIDIDRFITENDEYYEKKLKALQEEKAIEDDIVFAEAEWPIVKWFTDDWQLIF